LKLFLDTGALVARYNKDDEHHKEAVDLFSGIAEGKIGVSKLYCSDYIVDESLTTCYARTRDRKVATELGEAVLGSRSIVLLKVDELVFGAAWKMFREKYQDVRLSFTDCTTSVLLERHGIRNIFSFDRDFEILGFTRLSHT
jgi:predicted nucleic acid-binding protein